jgi:hypothetical protein
MSAYHKKADQSIEKSAYPLPMEQLTLSDLREAVKGRFSSFCTAVGIQALVTLMDQDVESMAGPKGNNFIYSICHFGGSSVRTSWHIG